MAPRRRSTEAVQDDLIKAEFNAAFEADDKAFIKAAQKRNKAKRAAANDPLDAPFEDVLANEPGRVDREFEKAFDEEDASDPLNLPFDTALEEKTDPTPVEAPVYPTPQEVEADKAEIQYLHDRRIKNDPVEQSFRKLMPNSTRIQNKDPEEIRYSFSEPEDPESESPEARHERVSTGFIKHTREVLPGLWAGFLEGMEQLGDLGSDLADTITGGSIYVPGDETEPGRWITQKEAAAEGVDVQGLPLPEQPELDTFTGEMAKWVGQFGVAAIPAARALKGLGVANKLARGLGTDAIATFAAFDPQEKGLADMLNNNPNWRSPVTELFAGDDTDSNLKARFRNAMEGVLVGGAAGAAGTVLGMAAKKTINAAADKLLLLKKKRALQAVAGRNANMAQVATEAEGIAAKRTAGAVDEAAEQADEAVAGAAPRGVAQAEEIAGVVDDVAAGADEVAPTVAKSVDEVAGVVDEGAAAVDEVAAVADEVVAVADDVAKQVDEAIPGAGAVDDVTRVVDDVARVVDDVSSTVGKAVDEVVEPLAKAADEAPVVYPGDEFVDPAAAPLLQVRGTGAEEVFEVNIHRLNTPEDIDRLFTEVSSSQAARIQRAKRGVHTHEHTQKLATRLGYTAQDILDRNKGDAFNAEQIVAANMILDESEARVRVLARNIQKPEVTAGELAEFDAGLNTHYALQQQVLGLEAEAGRALGATRIGAGTRARRQILAQNAVSAAGGKERLQALAATVLENGVDSTAKLAAKSPGGRSLYEYWANGLLSAASTHIANAVGNATTILVGNGVRFGAGLIHVTKAAAYKVTPDMFLSQKALAALDDGVRPGEAVAALYGQTLSIGEAFALGFHAFKDDLFEGFIKNYVRKQPQSELGTLSKLDAGFKPAITAANYGLDRASIAGRIVDGLGSLIRIPGSLLNASDLFFKTISYRGEMHALAYRQAYAAGHRGKDLAKKALAMVKEPTEQFKREAGAQAQEMAEYVTFTSQLGERGRKHQAFLNSVPFGRVIVPFYKTPTNILKYVGEHTPLALANKRILRDIRAGGAKGEVALAKIAAGSGLMGITAWYALDGTITGKAPDNPSDRARLYETGWQPYSIRVGDTYYSYAKGDPGATIIGMTADVVNVISKLEEEGKREQMAAAVVFSIANNLFSKTWLDGVEETLDMLGSLSAEPDARNAAFKRFVDQKAGTLVPAFVASLERTIDPTRREVGNEWDSFMNSWWSRIPGLSSSLPPVRNMYGEPVVLSGGIGPDIMSPVYASTIKNNPVSNEVLKQKTRISMPKRIVAGVDLTDEEYDEYLLLAAGKGNRYSALSLEKRLKNLFRTKAYITATDGKDGRKSILIRQVVHDMRRKAKQQFLEDNPRVKAKADQLAAKRSMELYGR